MSKFVNYKKRNVSLPPGCKNLIDLLRPREQENYQQILERAKRATVTRNESVTGTVSEISKYVAVAFESRGLMFTLRMSVPDERLTVGIARMDGETIWTTVTFQTHTEQDRKVRDFIARRGLRAPDNSPLPAQFYPDIPVQIIYHVMPLPSDPSALAGLVADLFRDACRLIEQSALHFHYDEVSEVG